MAVQALHTWFEENRRSFPWRDFPTPYRVWVSEVMLQQTRASVVAPYFERWMSLFPDMQTLAVATPERVMKSWEGLGYYRRARSLHEGAKQIVAEFGGNIPATLEDLGRIKGLGPYTTRAILAFAYRQRHAPVDGNVARVIARYFTIREEISGSRVRREIQQKADLFLDKEKPWLTAEALIELGATLCNRTPLCEECPLQHGCQAFREGSAGSLPVKASKGPLTSLTRFVAVVEAEGALLLANVQPGQVMAGLYEFPYTEGDLAPYLRSLGLSARLVKSLPAVKHHFTRYAARLAPSLFRTSIRKQVEGMEWIEWERIKSLPFSAGHRKILQHTVNHFACASST